MRMARMDHSVLSSIFFLLRYRPFTLYFFKLEMVVFS